SQFFTAVETFVNDADAASVGLAFVPEGINSTVMAEFKQGSYLGSLFGSVHNTDGPLLTGLPKGKYLMFGGGVGDPAAANKLIDDFAGPIIKEVLAVGPEMSPVQDYVAAMKAAVTARKGGAIGILAPTGALGTESMIQMVGVGTGDAKVMVDSTTKIF